MKSSRIELRTFLTPAECAARISASIDAEPSALLLSFASLFGSRPIIGWVNESSFSLRKRLAYRNSFQSFLTASMHREAGVTVISGKIAMHPFVNAFLFVWFGGVLLCGMFTLAVLASTLFGLSKFQQNILIGATIPFLMLVLGCGMVCIGRYLARDEARFLTDFLAQNLEAREQIPTA